MKIVCSDSPVRCAKCMKLISVEHIARYIDGAFVHDKCVPTDADDYREDVQ